jgi:hypothetical protein
LKIFLVGMFLTQTYIYIFILVFWDRFAQTEDN